MSVDMSIYSQTRGGMLLILWATPTTRHWLVHLEKRQDLKWTQAKE